MRLDRRRCEVYLSSILMHRNRVQYFQASLHGLHLFGVLLLLAVLLGCVRPQLGDTEAALALEDIAAGDRSSRLKDLTPLPSRRTLEYVIEGRYHRGDLYLSPQGGRAGLVLVPGLVAAGKDDSRVIALATTLARLHFAVLVPDLEGLRRYCTRASDVREVADAFRYLLSQPGMVPGGQVGIAGFSYGAGPVLLAGLEPDIREQVRFIATFGGYYDLTDLVTYFTTGYYRDSPESAWRYREPRPYIKWVFMLSNIDLLERPEDRALIYKFAAGIRDNAKLEIPVSELGPDAQALYALLTNKDPERVQMLISRLSPRIRGEMDGLDPAMHDLSQLRAQVIMMHGRSDSFIPYTESIALKHALPRGQAQLFLIEGYAHTDVRLKRKDIPQFMKMMEALLAQRAAIEGGEDSQ